MESGKILVIGADTGTGWVGVGHSLFYGSLKSSQISGVVQFVFGKNGVFFKAMYLASCCFSFFVCQIKNSKTEAN